MQTGYDKKPLIILTAGNTWTARGLGASEVQVSELNETRLKVQRELAAATTLGIDCVIEDAGHFIQIDRPSIVISAVESIIATNGTSRPTCPQ